MLGKVELRLPVGQLTRMYCRYSAWKQSDGLGV